MKYDDHDGTEEGEEENAEDDDPFLLWEGLVCWYDDPTRTNRLWLAVGGDDAKCTRDWLKVMPDCRMRRAS